jgi:hypothetical protein
MRLPTRPRSPDEDTLEETFHEDTLRKDRDGARGALKACALPTD